MASFNPKVREFLEEAPNKTMVGLAWSLYWRRAIVTMGIYLIVGGILALLASY